MSGYKYLKGSDGTGKAVLANITQPRSIGATVLRVNNLDNWPAEFIVVTGELNASGYLIPASMTEMIAHQTAGDIIIDGYAPGYSDIGNTTSPPQVAVLKPTTHIQNSMVENAQVIHNDDGSLKDNIITFAKLVSTIFGGQVQTTANSGSAGGTWSYINLGGIKLAWCIGTAGAVNTNVTRVFVPPTSFFASITDVVPSVVTANNVVYIFGVSYAPTSISVQLQSTVNMTATPAVLVIGT